MTIPQAAGYLGVARSTVYAMIRRGELHLGLDGELHFDELELIEPKGRGHPAVPSEMLIGRYYLEAINRLKSVKAVAKKYGVSRQAVEDAIATYKRAVKEGR